MMQQLPQERLVIGVGAVAAMQRAVELTVAYAKERTAFGKPLIGHQNTRMVLAECATRTRVCRVFLDDCIARHGRGELDVADRGDGEARGSPTGSARSSTGACRSSAATATPPSTRSPGCTPTPGCRRSTAAPTRS